MSNDIIGFENGIKIAYKYDMSKTIHEEEIKDIKEFHLYDRIRGLYQNMDDFQPLMITGFVNKIENNEIKSINMQFKMASFKNLNDFNDDNEKFREYSNDMLSLVTKIGTEKAIGYGVIFPISISNYEFVNKNRLFNFDIAVPGETLFEVKNFIRTKPLLLATSKTSILHFVDYIPIIEREILSSYDEEEGKKL